MSPFITLLALPTRRAHESSDFLLGLLSAPSAISAVKLFSCARFLCLPLSSVKPTVPPSATPVSPSQANPRHHPARPCGIEQRIQQEQRQGIVQLFRLSDPLSLHFDLTQSSSFLQSERALFYKPHCGRIAANLEEKKRDFPASARSSTNRRVDLSRKPGIAFCRCLDARTRLRHRACFSLAIALT